jgi:hypothetical protein
MADFKSTTGRGPSGKFAIRYSKFEMMEGGTAVQWEYRDEMVMFKETKDGLVSNLDVLNAWGAEGWELVTGVPLIAPNREGVAYGTVGALLVFKRPRAVS